MKNIRIKYSEISLFAHKQNRTSILVVSMVLMCLFFFMSCKQGKNKNENDNQSSDDSITNSVKLKEAQTFKVDEALDNRVSQIAGLDSSIFKDPRTNVVAKQLQETWIKKNQEMLQPIQKWVKGEKIYDPNSSKSTLVFYPFSGPDFEFANAFYPDADEYVLCGLEKAGNANSLIFSPNSSVDTFIQSASSYFYFSDRYGFFRTLDMKQHFREKGVVDIISMYLSKAGAKIGEVKLYNWNSQSGQLVSPENNQQPNVCFFKFKFPSGKISSLYYFEKDVSDPELEKDSLWLSWVREQASKINMVSLTKSASYLMHTTVFSKVRNFILNNSQTHIQDDTGISYGKLMESNKKLRLYGKYTKVIPVFRHYFQPDLFDKYKTDSIPALPFKIGYNISFDESSLQVYN